MRIDEASKATLVVERSRTGAVLSALAELGAPVASLQGARTVRFGKSRRLGLDRARPPLDGEQSEIVRFWTAPGSEAAMMEALRAAVDLDRPGSGSIFSERSVLYHGDDPVVAVSAPRGAQEARSRMEPLVGIVCIARRGLADTAARAALDLGLSPPTVFFGEGMGMREKLGLLRIAIPSDKETMLALCDPVDADEAMEFISAAIGLDAPGKGFLYSFPIERGMADPLIHLDTGIRHVASLEQVIAAVDELYGNTRWRRRSSRDPSSRGRSAEGRGARAPSVPGMACLTLYCRERRAEEHVRVAMELGAGGATLSGVSFVDLSDREGARDARESADIVMRSDLVNSVLDGLAITGFFSPDSAGIAESTAVSSTASYRRRSRQA